MQFGVVLEERGKMKNILLLAMICMVSITNLYAAGSGVPEFYVGQSLGSIGTVIQLHATVTNQNGDILQDLKVQRPGATPASPIREWLLVRKLKTAPTYEVLLRQDSSIPAQLLQTGTGVAYGGSAASICGTPQFRQMNSNGDVVTSAKVTGSNIVASRCSSSGTLVSVGNDTAAVLIKRNGQTIALSQSKTPPRTLPGGLTGNILGSNHSRPRFIEGSSGPILVYLEGASTTATASSPSVTYLGHVIFDGRSNSFLPVFRSGTSIPGLSGYELDSVHFLTQDSVPPGEISRNGEYMALQAWVRNRITSVTKVAILVWHRNAPTQFKLAYMEDASLRQGAFGRFKINNRGSIIAEIIDPHYYRQTVIRSRLNASGAYVVERAPTTTLGYSSSSIHEPFYHSEGNAMIDDQDRAYYSSRIDRASLDGSVVETPVGLVQWDANGDAQFIYDPWNETLPGPELPNTPEILSQFPLLKHRLEIPAINSRGEMLVCARHFLDVISSGPICWRRRVDGPFELVTYHGDPTIKEGHIVSNFASYAFTGRGDLWLRIAFRDSNNQDTAPEDFVLDSELNLHLVRWNEIQMPIGFEIANPSFASLLTDGQAWISKFNDLRQIAILAVASDPSQAGPSFVASLQLEFDAHPPAPECLADFNQSGSVSVEDVFAFLAAYSAQALSADINLNGTISVQDFFDFLEIYHRGCSN